VEAAVYARMTTTQLAPGESDDWVTVFESIVPVCRQLDGFKGMIIASEDEGQRVLVMSLWESEETLAAGKPVMDSLRDAETRRRKVESQETTSFRVVGFDIRWLSTQALGG
jgi:heme-degrading monooxygenase HmoA